MASASRAPLPDTTLGILAGGLATRLGGIDKAWIERDDRPQVLRITDAFDAGVGAVIVSANRSLDRYVQAGLRVVGDRHAGIGPLGGLHALSNACTTPWLLTLPVDILEPGLALEALRSSVAREPGQGAWFEDAQGVQPLVALWNTHGLADAIEAAIASRDFSVQSLQHARDMRCIRLHGTTFGNLNTPDDARAAGIALR